MNRKQFIELLETIYPPYTDGTHAPEWRFEKNGNITLIGHNSRELTFIFYNDKLYDWR